MGLSIFPLIVSAALITIRLWVTIKELSWLETWGMAMSLIVFYYARRKRFLHFLRNMWSSLNNLKSEEADDGNKFVETGNRNQPQDTHKEARTIESTYELNSSLKKRPGRINKNSVQTIHQTVTTNRATNTHHESANYTRCMKCKNYIQINNTSDIPTMPGCYHKFCKTCFEGFMSHMIYQMEVTMWICPVCSGNSVADYQTYFKELAVVLECYMRKDTVERANEKLDKWFKSQEQPVTLYDCEMCLKLFTDSELIRMPSCEHKFCETCTRDYFNIEIDERELAECYCPFCIKDQDMISKENLFEYFTKLSQIFERLLYSTTFQKFERKLKELSYTDMCIKCYSPVKAPCAEKNKVVKCQYCSTRACSECRLLWEPEHYRKKCKEYEFWIRNHPYYAYRMSRQPIDCYSCKERFLQVRDGTLMFSCPKCGAQMCHNCNKPFYLGVECPDGKEKCSFLFFHAHHPENCLFYMQSKKVDVLMQLLKENNLIPSRTSIDSYSCQVEVKKIVRKQIIYVKCGQILHNNYLGLCKNHAVEYLSTITVGNSVDTMRLLDESETKIFNARSWKKEERKQIDCATERSEENDSQIPHSSWQHTETSSFTIPSSEKMLEPMEIEPEESSRIESKVSTLAGIKSDGVLTNCNLNDESAASPHEEVYPSCEQFSQTSKKKLNCKTSFEDPHSSKVQAFHGVTTICSLNEDASDSSAENVCMRCYKISQNWVKNIFGCDHNFCESCIQLNFSKFNQFRYSSFLSCPICQRLDKNKDRKLGQAYLKDLRIALKKILMPHQYELFQEILLNNTTLVNYSEQGTYIRNSNLESGGMNAGSSSEDLPEAGIDASEMVIDG